MNRDLLETQWPQVREILKEKFSNLTDEDIRQINGRYDQLVAKLQQKYGYTREEAEERIRSWNFDRFSNTSSNQVYRDEKLARKETDNSSILKWLLALAIPLLLLGAYFLSTTPEMTRSPTVTNERIIVETPAEKAVSTGIYNSLLSQQFLRSDIQNVHIATHDGVVTLSGTVPTREVRESINTAAQNFAGVKRVNNLLEIK